jgi:hypothetical protein
MPNIQVVAERKREVIEAYHLWWTEQLPREPGQIGGRIPPLVEGPPVYTLGEVTAYSDFEPTRFLGVDQSFIDFLMARDIPFQEN